jgi:hypothetical protein
MIETIKITASNEVLWCKKFTVDGHILSSLVSHYTMDYVLCITKLGVKTEVNVKKAMPNTIM